MEEIFLGLGHEEVLVKREDLLSFIPPDSVEIHFRGIHPIFYFDDALVSLPDKASYSDL